jgi:membrane-associated phospholipid phosphatase
MRRNLRSGCLVGFVCAGVLSTATGAWAQTPDLTSSPVPQASPAPAPKTSTTNSLEKNFFKNLLLDQKAIWTSPFHFRTTDLRWFAPLVGGTAALIATDRRTGDWVATYPELVDPSLKISYMGTGYSVAGAAGVFYVIGLATHNTRARETGLLGVEALINTSIVGGVMKTVTQRARPDAGEDRGKFFVGGSSFPSGHSSGIWSLATVVALEYHDNRAVQITAYSIASLVSISRFTGQKHYLSDVLVGSALGYGIGRYVYRTHHVGEQGNVPSKKLPLIAPQYDRARRGYAVTVAWVY